MFVAAAQHTQPICFRTLCHKLPLHRPLDQQIGGLNEMVISNFGGIEPWKAIKTQELFARYVMPALREQ